MTIANNIQQFLEAEANFMRRHFAAKVEAEHASTAELLLARGRLFNYQHGPLPSNIERGKLGFCFRNAWEAVLSNPNYLYCEGGSYLLRYPHSARMGDARWQRSRRPDLARHLGRWHARVFRHRVSARVRLRGLTEDSPLRRALAGDSKRWKAH